MSNAEIAKIAEEAGDLARGVLSLIRKVEDLQSELRRLRGLAPGRLPPPEKFPERRRCSRCAAEVEALHTWGFHDQTGRVISGLYKTCVDELKTLNV